MPLLSYYITPYCLPWSSFPASIPWLTGILYRNGGTDSVTSIVNNLNSAQLDPSAEVVISPPALYLTLARQVANEKIGVAAQNVFDKPNGAFTGEISVEQLRDTKINWTIIGHSERRVILKESDEVRPLHWQWLGD